MIPLSAPWITNYEKKIILNSLNTSHLTDGPKLRRFESMFAKKTASRYAVGVSNGTAALHLSLVSLGIGPSDEVIIPDMTFVATANAVILSGATPVLADIDESLNISVESIEGKITRRTKAIIPVHFAGLACNMDKIMKIARKNNLYVIEDSAHSLGTYYKKEHVGTFGDAGCFSFYPTKNITTIEGGMIITNSKKLASRIMALRNHGLTKNLMQRNKTSKPWEYDIVEPGYNYRLDEVRSALGTAQLTRMDEIATKRIQAAKYYNSRLYGIGGLEVVNYDKEKEHAYHLYIIKIKKDFGVRRDKVHEMLYKKGIRTTVHYKPLHRFSYFRVTGLKDSDFTESTKAYQECLTLPLFATITRKQQDFVIHSIKELR
jgi:dTDP-4-amino-4,6-dideoxygalactose transaminase